LKDTEAPATGPRPCNLPRVRAPRSPPDTPMAALSHSRACLLCPTARVVTCGCGISGTTIEGSSGQGTNACPPDAAQRGPRSAQHAGSLAPRTTACASAAPRSSSATAPSCRASSIPAYSCRHLGQRTLLVVRPHQRLCQVRAHAVTDATASFLRPAQLPGIEGSPRHWLWPSLGVQELRPSRPWLRRAPWR